MIAVVGFMGLIGAIGCYRYSPMNERLDLAEEMMEDRPDSALYILNGIEGSELRGNRIKARHALLKSMALDKNYIDTTTFDVLQPAIDYYLKYGNADEKLRTYYYQGRIFQNAGNDDNAMQSYLNALDVDVTFKDSLMLARLFVAQGSLYSKQYRIEDCIDNNLKAADIYGRLGERAHQLRCYLRALNGEIILHDKKKADSILEICNAKIDVSQSLNNEIIKSLLKYAVYFGTDDEVRNQVEDVQEVGITDELNMILASAYTKIGEPETGLHYLNEANISSYDILDSLTYWSVKSEILENMSKDHEALDAFRNYSRLLETYHTTLFSNEVLFSEKKHRMEMENMQRMRKKDDIIEWISVGTLVLICISGLIYYRYRFNRAGRLLAERNAEKLQLETERLQLESDNLRLAIGHLEDESVRLSSLLERQDELSSDMRRIIHDRFELLNGLFASEITNEESHAREYRKYVESIRKDKEKFLWEIRRDLETTHSEFFTDLRDRGLTDREIDYVSLYAIGLRGKEIGCYLDVAGHYNISSEIRKKLGLDANRENLGPYIRRMMGVGLE